LKRVGKTCFSQQGAKLVKNAGIPLTYFVSSPQKKRQGKFWRKVLPLLLILDYILLQHRAPLFQKLRYNYS
jgi:hypothetical protein